MLETILSISAIVLFICLLFVIDANGERVTYKHLLKGVHLAHNPALKAQVRKDIRECYKQGMITTGQYSELMKMIRGK